MTDTRKPALLTEVPMTDGARIKVRRGGNPDRVRLYISNGNGFAADGYRVFWEPLLNRFELILFDMRNHGQNAPTGADGHHYQQMARDLGSIFHAVDSALGHKASVGVFHSMSGRASMKHAVEQEWVWDALVLFDPPNVPPRGHAEYDRMRTFELKLVEWAIGRQDEFASPDELLAYYNTNRAQSRWVKQARADMARAILRPEGDRYVLTCRRELEASVYLAALTLDLWPDRRRYGGPVKLLGADPGAKGAVPTAAANRALGLEGGYDYEAVPETGHLLQIERPDACRDAMLAFLAKHGLA
jgi:pimeloyl-ACP methyl ester carboxylesterase